MSGGYIPVVERDYDVNLWHTLPEEYPQVARDTRYRLLDPALSREERNHLQLQLALIAQRLTPAQRKIVNADLQSLRYGRKIARAGAKDSYAHVRKEMLLARADKEQLKQQLEVVNDRIAALRLNRKVSNPNSVMWNKINRAAVGDSHRVSEIFAPPVIRRRHIPPTRRPPHPPRPRRLPPLPPPTTARGHVIPSRPPPRAVYADAFRNTVPIISRSDIGEWVPDEEVYEAEEPGDELPDYDEAGVELDGRPLEIPVGRMEAFDAKDPKHIQLISDWSRGRDWNFSGREIGKVSNLAKLLRRHLAAHGIFLDTGKSKNLIMRLREGSQNPLW